MPRADRPRDLEMQEPLTGVGSGRGTADGDVPFSQGHRRPHPDDGGACLAPPTGCAQPQVRAMTEPEPESADGNNGLMAHDVDRSTCGLQEPLLERDSRVGIADNFPRRRIHPDDADSDASRVCKCIDRVLCIGSKRWFVCCESCCLSDDNLQQPAKDSKTLRGKKWRKTFCLQLFTMVFAFPACAAVFYPMLFLDAQEWKLVRVAASSVDVTGSWENSRLSDPTDISMQGRQWARTAALWVTGVSMFSVGFVHAVRSLRATFNRDGFREFLRELVNGVMLVFQGAFAYGLVIKHQIEGGQPKVAPVQWLFEVIGYTPNLDLRNTTDGGHFDVARDDAFVASSEMLYPALAYIFLAVMQAWDIAIFKDKRTRNNLLEDSNLIMHTLRWLVSYVSKTLPEKDFDVADDTHRHLRVSYLERARMKGKDTRLPKYKYKPEARQDINSGTTKPPFWHLFWMLSKVTRSDGPSEWYEFFYREGRKLAADIEFDWSTKLQQDFATAEPSVAGKFQSVSKETRSIRNIQHGLRKGGVVDDTLRKDVRVKIEELRVTFIEGYDYAQFSSKSFQEQYKAMIPGWHSHDGNSQDDNIPKISNINQTVAQPVISAIESLQQSPLEYGIADGGLPHGTAVFREDMVGLPSPTGKSCRDMPVAGDLISAEDVVHMIRLLAQADQILQHRWLWWLVAIVAFLHAGLPTVYAAVVVSAPPANPLLLYGSILSFGASAIAGVYIGRSSRNESVEIALLSLVLLYVLCAGLCVRFAPDKPFPNYPHGTWANNPPAQLPWNGKICWELLLLAVVSVGATVFWGYTEGIRPCNLTHQCFHRREIVRSDSVSTKRYARAGTLARLLAASCGLVVVSYTAVGMLHANCEGECDSDAFVFVKVAFQSSWTMVALSVFIVLILPYHESKFQLSRPILYGAIGVVSGIGVILGLVGWSVHICSFVVNVPLTFSITIRLTKCYENYYEKYRRMLYFLHLTPWSTRKAKKKPPSHGLLPTFDLSSHRNIVAWNKMRIFLEQWEKKSGQRRQHAVMWMLVAWMFVTCYQLLKFLNPKADASDMASIFVFSNTFQLVLGLLAILTYGVRINELQSIGLEHVLQVKSAELMSNRIYFLVNHATSHEPAEAFTDTEARAEWWRSAYSMTDCRHLDWILDRNGKPRAGICDQTAAEDQQRVSQRPVEAPEITKTEKMDAVAARIGTKFSAEPSLSELQRAAAELGIHADLLDNALDSSNPREKFEELILKSVPNPTERRQQLCELRLSALQHLAREHKVDPDKLSQALDASDISTARKKAVVDLIQEKNPMLINAQCGQTSTPEVNITRQKLLGSEQSMDKRIDNCVALLRILINTIKNEHGSGAREHWGGEDRRAKLVFIYMDQQALIAIIGTVLSVTLPAIFSWVSSIFKYDSQQAALEQLNQYCPSYLGNATAPTWELVNRSACIAEQIFSNLVAESDEHGL